MYTRRIVLALFGGISLGIGLGRMAALQSFAPEVNPPLQFDDAMILTNSLTYDLVNDVTVVLDFRRSSERVDTHSQQSEAISHRTTTYGHVSKTFAFTVDRDSAGAACPNGCEPCQAMIKTSRGQRTAQCIGASCSDTPACRTALRFGAAEAQRIHALPLKAAADVIAKEASEESFVHVYNPGGSVDDTDMLEHMPYLRGRKTYMTYDDAGDRTTTTTTLSYVNLSQPLMKTDVVNDEGCERRAGRLHHAIRTRCGDQKSCMVKIVRQNGAVKIIRIKSKRGDLTAFAKQATEEK